MNKLKESEYVELKKTTSELKESIKSIVAILNKNKKGELYFGVKNNSEVIGQDISAETLRNISKAISEHIEPKIYPKIKEVKIRNKNCLKVEFSGKDIPYFAFGRAYIRMADEDKRLSIKELERLFLKKTKIYWDSQYSDFKISQINERILKNYIQRGLNVKRISFEYKSKEITLKKLELLKNNHMLKAAEVLFYDKNSLEVQVALFASIDKTTFLDIKVFQGTIFKILEQTETYISERLNWRVEFKNFKRVEIPEVPIDAIREALVNSLCHRDYFKPESNKIAIFKNRIEIWNPGRFPEGLTPQDYIKGEEESVLRNPLIAKILYYSKDIEKWGTGLKRIYDECKLNKITVEFRNTKDGFKVILYRNEKLAAPEKTTQKTTPQVTPQVKLTELELKIFNEVIKNPKISRKQIADILNIKPGTVKEYLERLKKKGSIKRKGRTSAGYWEIIER
ncbi:MAG: putative DNA binding domain-containing protein [Candidatus Cloacimonetes bacterium]|nr:putative DNA binding domain-containing protein [Candidatus Cloacimonadota bacterium]